MKLQDLESNSRAKSQKVFESYFEKKINLDTITPYQASKMLNKVRSTVNEYRNSKSFHKSENNPSYLKAVFLEQALQSVIETDAQSLMMKDPKVKRAMTKVANKQPLSPDEEQLVGAMAMAKTPESKKKMGKKVMESEVQQAQVVLAAQDMVDRIQDTLEDVTEMKFKDLPALVDSIRNEVGMNQAQQYSSDASAALDTLIACLQDSKTAIEGAQSVITGQEPIVPGEDEGDVADISEPEVDLDVDTEVDSEEPESDLEASLGRARR